MKKRGSAIAAGGPAREQAREAVPVEAGALGALDAARSVTLQRHGSRAGGCVPVCLPKPRREPRRCLRGGAEGLAGERGAAMRHGRWVRTAKRAGGPSGPLTYTHLPCRAGKARQNVGIPRFRPHAKSHGNACRDCYEKCGKRWNHAIIAAREVNGHFAC